MLNRIDHFNNVFVMYSVPPMNWQRTGLTLLSLYQDN